MCRSLLPCILCHLLLSTPIVFSECTASILAIRTAEGFVESVEGAGTVCGLVLDRTIFYAEAGGQAEDHGFIASEANDVSRLPFLLAHFPP